MRNFIAKIGPNPIKANKKSGEVNAFAYEIMSDTLVQTKPIEITNDCRNHDIAANSFVLVSEIAGQLIVVVEAL